MHFPQSPQKKSTYHLATCDNLIELKCRYPSLHFSGVHGWGLKQMGNLFVYDLIHELHGNCILEVGAGLSSVFDNLVGKNLDYHIIDEPGFYPKDAFEEAQEKRIHTTFHPGQLGLSSDALDDNMFDVIFSISVLEHVKVEHIDAVCKEMSRVLKPGGLIIHSLDVFGANYLTTHGKGYLRGLKQNGFKIAKTVDINWDLNQEKPVLLEPLELIYSAYLNRKDDMWSTPVPVPNHSATILICAQKSQNPIISEIQIHLIQQLKKAYRLSKKVIKKLIMQTP